MNSLSLWWSSRTNKAAVLGALITAIDANSGFVSGFLPAEYRPYLVMLWPVLMLYFRSVTTGAVGAK